MPSEFLKSMVSMKFLLHYEFNEDVNGCRATLFPIETPKLCLANFDPSSTSQSPSSNQLPCYASTHFNRAKPLAQTAHGITYPSLTASQAIGNRAHILLQDAFLLEKLQSFNRERIPERVVHAKGAGAFGFFKVTNDVSKYTKAGFLKTIGRITRVAVRFSTVGGESGSADTITDPKGFATKFYTKEGIFDLVGNNIQVFPIRDPMLFPDLNRSRKRNPQTHLHDPTSFWDMTSLRPEMTMHTLYLFSDIARPKSLAYIDGAGVHTFKMVNADGIPNYVKFHWISNQKNKEFFDSDECVQMAGTNPDILLQDLFDRIERNEYLSWNLYIQVMTFDQAEVHPQNPFDVTKFWKLEDFPMILVGTMILNQNPKDYFTEVEQLAFSPSHMVPGIEPSPDRMLHARMFSYPDAQVYRLGVNFPQIPVNSCPFQVNTYQRDGHMNVGGNGAGAPNYFPNSFGGIHSIDEGAKSVKQSIFSVSGDVDRVDTGNDDNFSLPRYYLEKLVAADEKKRIIGNIAAFLGKADKTVQTNYIKLIAYEISEEFGDSLKSILNLTSVHQKE
ncbi:catalase-like [Bradysia coprophila]|uniref:catalase-like n=1 Tax=Bradysia coprophila TaxID=38358 RepID=UPI00187DC693|nr:catalase-like [Bradysia coprophila]